MKELAHGDDLDPLVKTILIVLLTGGEDLSNPPR